MFGRDAKKKEPEPGTDTGAFDLPEIIRKYEIEGGQSMWTRAIEYIKNILEKREHKVPVVKTQ